MNIFAVSKLGFGTSQIGGPSLINAKYEGAKPLPRNEALEILNHAFDQGINFFDTSDKYGNAEELLGEVFSARRDKVVIATKCGITDSGQRNFSLNYIKACLESSLRRMKANYIDIFQLAKPQVSEVTQELLSFFENSIKEGKVRHFGISVSSQEDGANYLERQSVESLQIFYNLLFTGSDDFIKRCASEKKFVIIRSPLNSGILSGHYTQETKFDALDSRSRIFHGELLRERLEAVEKLKKCFGLSSDKVLPFALNFIFSNDKINVVIPAASRIEQLKEYIRIFRDEKRFARPMIDQILAFSKKELCPEGSSQFK